MADTYFMFSEVVPHLTSEEEAWLRSQLQLIAVRNGKEIEIDDVNCEAAECAEWIGERYLRDNKHYDPDLDNFAFDFEFCDDDSPWGRHLWVYSEKDDGQMGAASLVQKFLKKFRPNQCWTLTWAEVVARLRVGLFGGGFIFVTANSIEWNWAHRQVEEKRTAFEAKNKEQPPMPDAGSNTGGERV